MEAVCVRGAAVVPSHASDAPMHLYAANDLATSGRHSVTEAARRLTRSSERLLEGREAN